MGSKRPHLNRYFTGNKVFATAHFPRQAKTQATAKILGGGVAHMLLASSPGGGPNHLFEIVPTLDRYLAGPVLSLRRRHFI